MLPLQQCKNNGWLHTLPDHSWFLIQANPNYKIFDKDILAIVGFLIEFGHYLQGNSNQLEGFFYTNHRKLKASWTWCNWPHMNVDGWIHSALPTLRSNKNSRAIPPSHIQCHREKNMSHQKRTSSASGSSSHPRTSNWIKFPEISACESFFEESKFHLDDLPVWFRVAILDLRNSWSMQDTKITKPKDGQGAVVHNGYIHTYSLDQKIGSHQQTISTTDVSNQAFGVTAAEGRPKRLQWNLYYLVLYYPVPCYIQ